MTQSVSVVRTRKALPHDGDLLFAVCRESYVQSFADHWNEGGLEWYLDKVYSLDGIKKELLTEDILYFVGYVGEVPAGFMKIRMSLGLDGPSGDALEIEKLYILAAQKGRGIGMALIEAAKKLATQTLKKLIWLDVIDTNQSAIAFYLKAGFSFHDKVRLELPYFKDELRGMHRMVFRFDHPV